MPENIKKRVHHHDGPSPIKPIKSKLILLLITQLLYVAGMEHLLPVYLGGLVILTSVAEFLHEFGIPALTLELLQSPLNLVSIIYNNSQHIRIQSFNSPRNQVPPLISSTPRVALLLSYTPPLT